MRHIVIHGSLKRGAGDVVQAGEVFEADPDTLKDVPDVEPFNDSSELHAKLVAIRAVRAKKEKAEAEKAARLAEAEKQAQGERAAEKAEKLAAKLDPKPEAKPSKGGK